MFELLQSLLCLLVIGTLLEQLEKDRARLFVVSLDFIDFGEIKVRLVILRCKANRLLEAVDCFLAAVCSQIEDAKIVEGLWVGRAQGQRFLKILIGAFGVILLLLY